MKKHRKRILLKIIAGIIICYLFLVILFFAPFSQWLTYPNASRAVYYEPLANWNLFSYGYSDYDGDGVTDFISPLGYAVLSKRDELKIAPDRVCACTEFSKFANSLSSRTVAEKYFDFAGEDADWHNEPFHSYLIKQKDLSAWNIVVFRKGHLTKTEITETGELVRVNPGIIEWINLGLYTISFISFAAVAVLFHSSVSVLGDYTIFVQPILLGWIMILSLYFFVRGSKKKM